MTITTTGRRILAAAAIAGASLVAAPAASGAAPTAIPPACSTGYVCVQTDGGSVVRVPAGESLDFDPALQIDWITNQTRLDYCVAGSPSFLLPAGGTSNRDQTVTAVGPGDICAT